MKESPRVHLGAKGIEHEVTEVRISI